MYQSHHHSCYLYLGSILVDIFGIEQTFKGGLIQMMQVISSNSKKKILNLKTL
jgi:transportin-3